MGLLTLVIHFRSDVKTHTLLAELSGMITSQFRESQDLIHCPTLGAKWIWPWHLPTVHGRCQYLGGGNELNVFLFSPWIGRQCFQAQRWKLWQPLCEEVPVIYLNWFTTSRASSQNVNDRGAVPRNSYHGDLAFRMDLRKTGKGWNCVLFHTQYKAGCELTPLHSPDFSSWWFLGPDDLTEKKNGQGGNHLPQKPNQTGFILERTKPLAFQQNHTLGRSFTLAWSKAFTSLPVTPILKGIWSLNHLKPSLLIHTENTGLWNQYNYF